MPVCLRVFWRDYPTRSGLTKMRRGPGGSIGEHSRRGQGRFVRPPPPSREPVNRGNPIFHSAWKTPEYPTPARPILKRVFHTFDLISNDRLRQMMTLRSPPLPT